MAAEYARLAQQAIADEHEANTRHYVEQMRGCVDQVVRVVRDW